MLDLEAIDSGVETEPSDRGSDHYLSTDDDGSAGYRWVTSLVCFIRCLCCPVSTGDSPETGGQSADEAAEADTSDNESVFP